MKLTHYIYISAALAMLCACGEDLDHVCTVGEADNAIVFMAGVSDGGQAKTRANSDTYVQFAGTTQLRLYVEGSWTDHTPGTITQYTNCSTTTANDKLDGDANDIHPLGSYSPTLYWDDYGTADPANIDNRANGLAVFGVGIDGLSSLPNELNSISGDSWTSLSWSVNTDGASVLTKDIVVSKNLGDNSSPDKTGLKFDKRESNVKTDNLLIFEHMMSKVTFILKAGNGFDNGVFKSAPEVILTRNKHGETTETEYCLTSGTIKIKTAEVTGTAASTSTVKAQVTNTNLTGTALSSVEEQALIFPGSDFGSSDNAIIARIKADDNIYYVSAEKIRAKLNELYSSEDTSTRYQTKKGVNYVITVNINKTDISVTATVKEWTSVNAEESPVIDVNNVWGGEEHGTLPVFTSFSFYRSTSLNSGYSTINSDLKEGDYYKSEATVSNTSSNWVFDTPLYWPNHLTHFQFRGVYPLTTTTENDDTKPRVETEDDIQVIKVWNVAYVAESFPSDLMIARPDVKTTDECTNKEPGHTKTNLYSGGICATEGSINMHFNYMMSQVEVNLKTTTGDNKVNLTKAKVELVNVYNTGNVKLGVREAVVTGDKGTYELNPVSGTGNENKRLSAIVPQTLTFSSKGAEANLRFKITIYNTETPTKVDDVYYADVKPILKKGTTDLIAPTGKWEAGQRYVYDLLLTKTQIEVTATLKNWDEVEASENIWF